MQSTQINENNFINRTLKKINESDFKKSKLNRLDVANAHHI